MLNTLKNIIAKWMRQDIIKWIAVNEACNFCNQMNDCIDYKGISQKIILALVVVLGLNNSAMALNASEVAQLNQLDPQTRIEQRCDIEAMSQIGKNKKWRPDRILAYAFSMPTMSNYTVTAKGAAFRSKGDWYHLSYICKTQDDYVTMKSFEFKIGDLIPRADWNKHYLVP